MDGPVIVVALGGGSGAGKTMLAAAIAAQLTALRVERLSEDDYYRDIGAAPGFDAARFNFDEPAARDYPLLADQLRRLRVGEAIEAPRYCFATHRRLTARRQVTPAQVVIIEGSHILGAAPLRPLIDLAVYVDVADDLRLARRLLRDIRERGRDPAAVIDQYLTAVRPMHRLHTEPTRSLADLVIRNDQAMPPEPAALDRLVAPIVARIAVLRTHRGRIGGVL
jgi:uridine kinase